MSKIKRPLDDALPPPEDLEANVQSDSRLIGESATTPSRKLWDFIVGYCVVPGLLLALLGGCWWNGHKAQKERAAKEAEVQSRDERKKTEFESYARDHGAMLFDPYYDYFPSLTGETTADVQLRLKSKPIALEFRPDLRLLNGGLRLTDDYGYSRCLFEFEISESQAAVARQAKAERKMVWVIAQVNESNAKEEPREHENGSRMELVIRSSGKVLDCQPAP